MTNVKTNTGRSPERDDIALGNNILKNYMFITYN